MRKKRILSIMSVFVLALVLLMSNNAFAEGKISKNVAGEFDKNKKVTYIVKFKAEANLDKVVTNSNKLSLNNNESSEKAKKRLKKAVYKELKAVASESQEEAVDILDKKVATKNNGVSYEQFNIVNAILVTSDEATMNELANLKEVEKITLDEKIVLNYEESNKQSDETSEIPWNISNTSVDQAWAEGYDGEGIVVANIDSGVAYSHEALKDNWRGNNEELAEYSWFDTVSDSTTKPVDGDGHGTHTMGSIVGTKNNIGVAPKAEWIAVRIFDDEGEATSGGAIAAGEWILAPSDKNNENPRPDLAPDVVNNSWGTSISGVNEYYRDIVKAWNSAGILSTFSAGNINLYNKGGYGSISAPANYPESFSVGAIDENDVIGSFSLLGKTPYGEIKPDVVAPGVAVNSAFIGSDSEYKQLNGTSMAAPHVAGLMALVIQANPDLSVEEVHKIIKDSTSELTDEKYTSVPNVAYGQGKINALLSLAKATGKGSGIVDGVISAKQEDNDNPDINHVQVKTVFDMYDAPIGAEISDNNGIKYAKIYIKKSSDNSFKEFDMDLVSGNKKSGKYEYNLKVKDMDAAGLTYYIEASDVNNNISKTMEANISVSEGIKIGYKQDFESNIDGFIFSGSTPMWEWGTPVTGPSNAASGNKVIATRLDGEYKGLDQSIMVLPVIDLTSTNKAVLEYKQWLDLDNASGIFDDTAEVWIGEIGEDDTSVENIDYELARLYKKADSTNVWQEQVIDLSKYKGKKISVMFGLRYGGWTDCGAQGWYVDDIEIKEPSVVKPATPHEYLSGSFRASTGGYTVSFYKLNDANITKYNLYRSQEKEGNYTLVSSLDVKDIAYQSVSLTDYAIPQEGTYYYYATSDSSGVESDPTKVFEHTFTKGELIKKFDFEGNDGGDKQGWKSVGATDFDFGEIDPTVPVKTHAAPASSTYRAKNPGYNLWATNMYEARKSNTNYVIESPSIDLSNRESVEMYFQEWFGFMGKRGADEWDTYDDDYGYVYISKDDGTSWEKVFTLNDKVIDKNNKFPSRTWNTESIQIPSDYLVENFKVRFELETRSDTSGPYVGGWYLDDIQFRETKAQESPAQSNDDLKQFKIKKLSTAQLEKAATSNDMLPLDALVQVKENKMKTLSKVGSGEFKIKLISGEYTLLVSKKGYQTKEVNVNVKDNVIISKNIVLEKKVTLAQISEIKAISISSDTSIKKLKTLLPDKVKVKTVDNEEIAVDVKWNIDEYKVNKVKTYTFKGELVYDKNIYELGDDLSVEIKVTTKLPTTKVETKGNIPYHYKLNSSKKYDLYKKVEKTATKTTTTNYRTTGAKKVSSKDIITKKGSETIQKAHYKYNTKAKLTSSKVYKKNSKNNYVLTYSNTRTYHKNLTTLKTNKANYKNLSNKYTSRKTTTYIAKGYKAKHINLKYQKGIKKARYEYKYNSKGQLKSDKNGKSYRYYTSYNNKGKAVKTMKRDYSSKGKLNSKTIKVKLRTSI